MAHTLTTHSFKLVPTLMLHYLLLLHVASGTCPSQEAITPCNCTEIKDGISLYCNGSADPERIADVLQQLESSANLELVLQSLTRPVLPESITKATSLRLLSVQIARIPENFPSVSRLNDLVVDSSTITDEPWEFLSRTTALRHLKISNVAIPAIGSEFREGVPAGIAYLDLRKTRTTVLHPHAMSRLTKLKYLLMVDMPLQKFPRNALPVDMHDLHTFILCNTLIGNLEEMFFEGMPNLKVLMLNGNQFKTLNYPLLAPVHKHLTYLLAERNPLVCDCNIIWLTKNIHHRDSTKVMATCLDTRSGVRQEATMLDEDEYCS